MNTPTSATNDSRTSTLDLVGILDSHLADVPDETLPRLLDELDDWLESRRMASPACRRDITSGMAEAIAAMPGLYRHWIGDNDEILDRHGPTGLRMQDFIADDDLATYRTYVYGPRDRWPR